MTNPVGRVNGRYATQVGGKPTNPSVTTVLGVLNKPGLPWGAAKETALFAYHHRDEWEDLAPEEAVDRLRKHHRGVWDDKANRGSIVHGLALLWAKGEECDCPPDCGPYMDALERFYDDWAPEWTFCEETVVFDHPTLGYGGTFDAIADLADGHRWLLDIKTGADVWPETALQLAAYRHATSIAVYGPMGGIEALEPNCEVERCGVIHLRGDGTYGLVPLQAGRREWDWFLDCRRLYEFTTSKVAKSLLGEPLLPPRLEAMA